MDASRVCASAKCTNSIDHMARQARYCSESCRQKSKTRSTPTECVRCGGPMPGRHPNAKYCSTRCGKAAKNAAYYARHYARIRKQQREYNAANAEAKRERDADYYASMKDEPEFRTQRQEYARGYYTANRERILEDGRRRREANPEAWVAKNRAWLAANPDRRREYRANRRAREMNAFVEDIDRTVVWDRDRGVCYLCGLPADRDTWHLDHVRPLVDGGTHSYDNVAVTHPSCNQSKGGKAWPDVSFMP